MQVHSIKLILYIFLFIQRGERGVSQQSAICMSYCYRFMWIFGIAIRISLQWNTNNKAFPISSCSMLKHCDYKQGLFCHGQHTTHGKLIWQSVQQGLMTQYEHENSRLVRKLIVDPRCRPDKHIKKASHK